MSRLAGEVSSSVIYATDRELSEQLQITVRKNRELRAELEVAKAALRWVPLKNRTALRPFFPKKMLKFGGIYRCTSGPRRGRVGRLSQLSGIETLRST